MGRFPLSGPAVSVVGVGRQLAANGWIFSSAVISGDEPKEKLDLVSYFGKRPPGVLHCTTKFCDYGKATGAEEYAQQDVSSPQGRPGGGGESEWAKVSSGAAASGRYHTVVKCGLLSGGVCVFRYPLRDSLVHLSPEPALRGFPLK